MCQQIEFADKFPDRTIKHEGRTLKQVPVFFRDGKLSHYVSASIAADQSSERTKDVDENGDRKADDL